MSIVTGVMLVTSRSECEGVLESIGQWLEAHDFYRLNPVDEHCCNGKHPQTNFLGGGYNYFLNDAFADFVMTAPWRCPENVVLVLQPEEGTTRVCRPNKFKELAR